MADLPHFDDSLDALPLAEAIVAVMTDGEALGQTLMFGYPGEEPDAGILRWISDAGLGGVKVFGWNARNLEILAETAGVYQQRARSSRFGIPLLIATDQEGGLVRHVKGRSSITPGNMALGAVKRPYDAWITGYMLGQELAAVGVNMNFAPTVDLFVNPQSEVVGSRAFMADPAWTGILGLSFAKGQETAGVISTAKHFPGHGDTAEDSHGTLPTVLADLATLLKRDLVPYRTLINGGVPAVMVGHLAHPAITGNAVPATLSPKFLFDILRGELGFDGVVVTDDLFMDGVRMNGDPLPQICSQAMTAGSDILLISQGARDHRNIHQHLMEKMRTEAGFNRRVREAATRVVSMKATWLRGEKAVPLIPDYQNVTVPAPGAEQFFLEQAARSITVIRNAHIPMPPEESGRLMLVGSYKHFLDAGLQRYPHAETWRPVAGTDEADLRREGRRLLQTTKAFDTVIALLPNKETAILLDALEPIAEKVIVLSVYSPTHLRDWFQTVLAAYGAEQASFHAAFAALVGDFVPEGQLPIPLETSP